MKIPTIISTMLFFTSCDCLQNVTGTVIDEQSDQPIQGVHVQKENKDHDQTTTDEKGYFEIRSISGGLLGCPPMTVVLRKEGYELQTVKINNGGNQTIKLIQKEINLSDLDEVKSMLNGKWYRIHENDTITEVFSFRENSFEGECKSKQYISTAPLFELLREDNWLILRWKDLTGGTFDFIITELSTNQMTMKSGNEILKYFRK